MIRSASRRVAPVGVAAFLVAIVAAVALDIDWTPFTSAVTGIIPTLTILVAGVIVAVITIAVLFRSVRWLTRLVTSFMK